LPFSYYYHFVLEESFGFNKQTISLWVGDMLKSQGLSLAFGIPLGAAFLKIIQKTGDQFFFYLWAFTLGVQLFAITIYPIVIVPIFNKLTPLEPGTLKDRVESLAARLKFPLGELQVIDGSKRSAHSNAYFTGLPWKKKIVLYDTLIDKSSEKEVEAILAHELGHWKMGHTTKLLGIASFHLFYVFALFSVFINNRSLYEAFGFYREKPIMIGFILFNEVLSPTDSVVKLLMNILTRRFEFEAGMYTLWSFMLISNLRKLTQHRCFLSQARLLD
jgi:STE24 endopeptidase